MKRKDAWKLAVVITLLVFAFPIAPEIGMLVALLDMVGLELLLLLFEVQVILPVAAV